MRQHREANGDPSIRDLEQLMRAAERPFPQQRRAGTPPDLGRLVVREQARAHEALARLYRQAGHAAAARRPPITSAAALS